MSLKLFKIYKNSVNFVYTKLIYSLTTYKLGYKI